MEKNAIRDDVEYISCVLFSVFHCFSTDESMKPHPPQFRKRLSTSYGNSLIVKDKSHHNQVTKICAKAVTLSPSKNKQLVLVVQNQQWSPDKALSLICE